MAVPRTESLTTGAVAGDARAVAVVDDDPVMRVLMRRALEPAGFTVVEFASGGEVLAAGDACPPVVCLDLGLGDLAGADVLQHLRARNPDVAVIVVTAERDVETAVGAMRGGAYDYVIKPFDARRLQQTVARACERVNLSLRVTRLQGELTQHRALGSIIGDSPAMRELARQLERVQNSDVTVCVQGESGTGKELVASAIHAGGRRSKGPFVAINCAAIAESLQESELFGHERGAFTGAAGVHRGRFEQAHGGTLFLDELGELSASTQARLLRALQERTICRVGGTVEIPVDVRIVCATHRDLAALVQAGRFREDLYFRLVVYPVVLPALRERREDIPALVAYFLQRFQADVGRPITRVSAEALEALRRHAWPGNVRELQNVVHRSMLACDGDEIDLAHLPPALADLVLPPLPAPPAAPAARAATESAPTGEVAVIPLRELEKRAIENALAVAAGNVGRAAKLLGISRATLYRRLAEHSLPGAEGA